MLAIRRANFPVIKVYNEKGEDPPLCVIGMNIGLRCAILADERHITLNWGPCRWSQLVAADPNFWWTGDERRVFSFIA